MKNKLILYGASNFADEIVQLFRDINRSKQEPEWEILGFLDDNESMAGVSRNGIPVLGNAGWLDANDTAGIQFVCCIGNPVVKARIVEKLKQKNVRFASGIHPSVIISETSSIGEGTVITAGNIITTNVRIGDHVIVNLACTIGHQSVIGTYGTINPGTHISGDVTLGEGVLMGTGSVVLEKRSIGDYAIVGGGAVVNKDLPDRVTAVGVPAKIIKTSE